MKREAIISALGLSAALATLAQPGAAQGIDEFGPYGRETSDYESPQNMAVELRVGRYYPLVDSEFADTGETPFRNSFGARRRWFIGFEVDWQLFRIPYVGTIGPAFGASITNLTGKGFLRDGTVADQSTNLSVIPTYGVGVLRIDTLSRLTPVPLAFYGKLGFGYSLWWTRDNVGVTRGDDGSRGEGASYGTHWALGAMFLLDALDQRRANDVDATHGVNNSYIFVEWYKSNLDGFGSGSQMQVGSSSWTAGLALEL
jgi:hypothetical protein